jgi:Tol biopolymer transport system component
LPRLVLILLLLLNGCSNSVLLQPQISGALNSNTADQHPSYSSDGRYLAFASDRNGSRSIYLYDQQQRRFLNLPNLNRRNSSQDEPYLSADGRFIAYVTTERGRTDIMIYDRTTERSELITSNIRGEVAHPTVSQDGRKIAFETTQLGQWHIAIVER